MRHIRHPLVPALAAVAVLAGCATADTRRAAYEQALSRWQGASEADLVARWGPPVSVQAEGQAKWLTFVSRAAASTPTTTVAFSFGGFGWGRHGGLGVGVGGAVPVATGPAPEAGPAACTTRFLVEDGRVSSWNFDGPGCGAYD